MAKNNPGDLLTCDWNPVIGCEKYSAGCRLCWYLDGVFAWQQRVKNIPANVKPTQMHVFNGRMNIAYLRPKKGIIGVCQHGDLFWNGIPDAVIHQTLDLVDLAATMPRKPYRGEELTSPKFVLWSKRAERMINLLSKRYDGRLPDYLACSISAENQQMADERFPHFAKLQGMKIAMMEPMIGPVDMTRYVELVSWVVVGSETAKKKVPTTPIDYDWVRNVRDVATEAGKSFFIKQLGPYHKKSVRMLDGRTWDEFPEGWVK